MHFAVLERIPVFARFSILDFIDLGGDLNIKVTLDQTEDVPLDPIPIGLHQEVYICISKDRQPKMVGLNSKIKQMAIFFLSYHPPFILPLYGGSLTVLHSLFFARPIYASIAFTPS